VVLHSFRIGRLLAGICVCVLLLATIAAPIHKHSSNQEGTCLICHTTEGVNVVSISADVGKPSSNFSSEIAASLKPAHLIEVPLSTRTPRAPPFHFHSL
jgi:hypothetical protein